MTEEGLFKSTHNAVVFALNQQYGTYQRPMINRMAYPSAIGNGIGGYDAAAQAGMILAEIRKLGFIKEAILVARVAPKRRPCDCRSRCCSGSFENKDWRESIFLINNHLRDMSNMKNMTFQLRDALIRKYFGSEEQQNKIAERCFVHRDTVAVQYSKAVKELTSLEKSAWRKIDEFLIESGMIEQID
jgi:hypothetical protein